MDSVLCYIALITNMSDFAGKEEKKRGVENLLCGNQIQHIFMVDIDGFSIFKEEK